MHTTNCIYMQAHIDTAMHIHMSHPCMHMHTHVHTQTCTHTQTHTDTDTDTDTHTHRHTHTQTHTHTHTHTHTLTSTVASIFPLRPNLASLVNTPNSTLYTYRGLHMHSSISCTPDTPTWQLVIHWLSSWQFGVLLDHYIIVLKITRYRIPSELNLSFTRYGGMVHELFNPVK